MMTCPEISVVMGVFNDREGLSRSVKSVLTQDVDLQFLIVDDGSTDGTWDLLQDLAVGDKRIVPQRQEHQGLTIALIKGCETATTPYIARQDAGDISLGGRLAKQLAMLRAMPDAALVSCDCR